MAAQFSYFTTSDDLPFCAAENKLQTLFGQGVKNYGR